MVMYDLVKPIEIIETTIDNMRYSGVISDVVASGSNWTITIEDTTNLSVDDYITNASRRYKIVTKTNSTQIVVSGSQAPTATAWKSEAPYFYHGTPKTIDGQRAVDMVGNEMKYPFICLFEPLRSRNIVERSNDIAEEFDLWLVFMTKNNPNWSTDEHHTNAINDMMELYNRFVEATENYPTRIKLLEDGEQQPDITRHANFGLVAKTKGHEDYILNDNLSGVEVENFKLKVLKTYDDINC